VLLSRKPATAPLSKKRWTAPPRPDRPHRRADIQGLRAVAVLLVVLYHAGIGPPGGFVGVDLFFVVSGFVITGLLYRELQARNRLSLGDFYLARARRLLPAFALVSLVTVALGALLLSPIGPGQQTLGLSVAAAAGFVANAYFFSAVGGYFQPTAASDAFLHTWTLSVEEQFYLVFPLLLLVGWRLSRRLRSRRWLAGLLLVSFVLSLALELWLTFGQFTNVPVLRTIVAANPADLAQAAFYLPATRAWEFLAGALTALAVSRWSPRYWLASLLGVCGVAALVVAVSFIQSTQPFPGLLAAVPVAAAVSFLLAGSTQESPSRVTRLLSAQPAVLLGDLSYSWYLWHWPAIVFAQAVAPGVTWITVTAALGSLGPAALSYRLVERPIHRRQILGSRRATAVMGVVCVALASIAGGALVLASRHSWDRPSLAALQATIGPEHLDQISGCDQATPLGSPLRPPCTWTVGHPRGTILLIGDSNAGQLTEPVLAATRHLGYDMQVASYGGCPLLVRPRYFNASCQQFVEGTIAAIKARTTPYAAIVLSNASVGYVNGPLIGQFATDAPATATGTLRQRAIAGWVDDVGRTLRAIGHRSPVLVMGAIPQFPALPTCIMPSLLRGPTASCGELTPAEATLWRSHLITAERPVVASLGARYLNTGRLLCRPNGSCSAFIHGTLVYRDAAHLSVSGSMIFEPALRKDLHRMTSRGSRHTRHLGRPEIPSRRAG